MAWTHPKSDHHGELVREAKPIEKFQTVYPEQVLPYHLSAELTEYESIKINARSGFLHKNLSRPTTKKRRKKTMLYATKVEDWWTLYLRESLQDGESNGCVVSAIHLTLQSLRQPLFLVPINDLFHWLNSHFSLHQCKLYACVHENLQVQERS